MNIKHELPPIWDEVNAAGMRPDPRTVIFTYGDTIYVPSGNEIPDDLLRHEETHSRQQGADPKAWWARYITDPYFRVQQEAEAYGAQYRFICDRQHDRNQRFRVLYQLAGFLSGPTYGQVVSHQVAMELVRSKSGIPKP